MAWEMRGHGGKLLTALLLAGLVLGGLLYWGAVREPVVRQTSVSLGTWEADRAPIRVLFLSDIHVAGPDMPPSRLTRIVAQVNATKPDLILIGGDLVSDKSVATQRYAVDAAVRPLDDLHAPLGVYAVLGNHDHWRDTEAFREALPKFGIVLLENEVREVGPLQLAGIGDEFTGNDDPAAIKAALRPGIPAIGFTHSPDVFPRLDGALDLLFAGHTHCGQIVLPLIGAPATMSQYGDRFACGRIDESDGIVFVSAGLGTSLLPIRLGARPDMWLVTVGR